MDVEDSRPDLEVAIPEELVEEPDVAIVLRAAELDRGDVDSGIRPQRHDLPEVAVAHVRVHLNVHGLVEDAVERCTHTSGIDLAQSGRVLGGKRPTLAHRRLVDLN